jgi:hypothetical protein
MAAPPDADRPPSPPPADRGGELDDRPPFLTWRKIYVLVIAALAVQVVTYALLSRAVQ